MLWQAKQSFAHKVLAKLYQIQPKLLASDNDSAWTNLGLWQSDCENQQQHLPKSYVQAAQQLAQQMGQALNLTVHDDVLDVGCGYGASVALWQQNFGVQHIAALELQPSCCQLLNQKKRAYLQDIFQQSIFDAKPEGYQGVYDVVVSIDAAYHYHLSDYLNALDAWLAEEGRIGFHLLIKSDQWDLASSTQQQQIAKKLKWAKVPMEQVLESAEVVEILTNKGYEQIQIEDLTAQVLQGFADYIENKTWSTQEKLSTGFLKIYLTANLCRQLAASGCIHYVQVTAKKIQHKN